MSKQLKVYGGNLFTPLGQRRAIVAATSKAEVSRLIGWTVAQMRDYWCETGNERELEQALAQPGVILVNPDRNSRQSVCYVPLDEVRKQ